MIQYDTPIEVTEKQYGVIMRVLPGIVAGRESNGKYYVKLWYMTYAHYLNKILNA